MATKRKNVPSSDGTNIWMIAAIGMSVTICLSWCFGHDLVGLLIAP